MAENNLAKEGSDYYFGLAVQQYVTINFVFMLDHVPFTQIKALCAGVKKGYLVTKASLEKIDRHPVIWGSEVNGYFTVRDDDLAHCHFKSRLVRMYMAPGNAMFLVFPLPRFLDFNQQRFSRRVRFEKDLLESLGVWHGELKGGGMESLPQLSWHSLKSQQCEIGDISATGLMLQMPAKSPLAPHFNIHDRILMRGNFGTPARAALLFILGAIVRKMPDIEDEERLNIGCSFLNWRRVEDTRNTSWIRCDPQEGIAMVSQWISRNYRSMQV